MSASTISPHVEILSAADIEERRAELLRRSGMSLDELRERSADYELDQIEQAILRQLEELEFLARR